MILTRKKILCTFAAVLCAAPVFAASTITELSLNELSWRYLQAAEIALQVGRYDDAMKACEDAKLRRSEESEYETQILDSALKPQEVAREGDLISDVLPVLRRREASQALKIIDKYLDLFGAAHFENSISAIRAYVKSRTEYPEADYMIGTVYRYEGEYTFAEKYYLKAYNESALLEIPDVKYDILYDMAEIARIQNKNADYEKYLTLIIADDAPYWDTGLDKALLRTIDTNMPDSVEKFFKLYRTKEHRSLNAYEALAEYYTEIGEKEKAIKAIAFASLTGFSKIYDIVKERNTRFVYTNVSNFFHEAGIYGDITEWGIDNNIWRSFFMLAEYAERRGCGVFANSLYSVIAESFPEEYWRNKAATRIARKSVE